MSGKLKDLTGKKFGRLTVIGRDKPRDGKGRNYWICNCSCGGKTSVSGDSLRKGKTGSCGCVRRETLSTMAFRHGHSVRKEVIKEYSFWIRMKALCQNKDSQRYPGVGGKGIKVCAKWDESFEAFIADVGMAPSPDHEMLRIDKTKDYCPENCQWATKLERATKDEARCFFEMNGETKTVADWARTLGIKYHCLWRRIKDDRDPLTGKRK